MRKDSNDSLGARMKRMEAAHSHSLTPRVPVIVRVDGRAFHTFTRGLDKPYDRGLISCMRAATMETAKSIQGCKLAYTQSNESSFLLTDYDTIETQGWFGYNLSKVVSLSASTFTMRFNMEVAYRRLGHHGSTATFDSRAFNIPESDVANYFLWRAKDWRRNSIQMTAKARFSQKTLHGVKIPVILEMLRQEGQPWPTSQASGVADHVQYGGMYDVTRDVWVNVEPCYEAVAALVDSVLPRALSTVPVVDRISCLRHSTSLTFDLSAGIAVCPCPVCLDEARMEERHRRA